MNDYYKQPVAVFGIALPILFMALLGGTVSYTASSTAKDYKKKKRVYDKAQAEMREIMDLQGKVQQTSAHLSAWNHLLSTETRGSFLEHWKEAERKFSGKELTKTSHNWVNFSEGIGKGAVQPASQVNMSFSATYRAMQMALLEMETKLPQMQLDSMTMTPAANGESIDVETKFTVWTLK